MPKPLFMLMPVEERIFPHQLDDMAPEEREAAEQAMEKAKKKWLVKVQAFFELLAEQAIQQAKWRSRMMWVRNFLNWRLGVEYVAQAREMKMAA
jgi:hypothetical protein